jgi:hypothetical protein
MATNENDNRSSQRLVGFYVPPAIAAATKAAADREMLSMSDICRRALVVELKARGFLTDAA